MKKNFLLLIVVLLMLSACGTPTDEPYPPPSEPPVQSLLAANTIAGMISGASTGTTITVPSGDYSAEGRISVNKAITVKCAAARTCTIRAASLTSGANMDGFYVLDNPSNDGGIVGANNNDITNNLVSGSCMVGIKISGSNSLVDGNEITQSRQCLGGTGIDADGIRFFGSGHVIRRNYIHDIKFAAAHLDGQKQPHVDCFQTYQSNTTNILIENNICDNFDAVVGENNGTQGANLEHCSSIKFVNNYFHVYGKGILWESTCSGSADNNIFVSGPKISGSTGGQYCLFGDGAVTGNICYLYTSVLVAGAHGTGNVTTNPQMSGYCSLAFPSKGVPCGVVSTATALFTTPTLTPSITPSRTPTPSIMPSMTRTPTFTYTATVPRSPTPTATPTRTPIVVDCEDLPCEIIVQ